MKHVLFALLFVLAASPAYALTGRWITQSGNLGNRDRPMRRRGLVWYGRQGNLSESSYEQSGVPEMTNAAVPALGLKVLRGFRSRRETTTGRVISSIARMVKTTYRCRP